MQKLWNNLLGQLPQMIGKIYKGDGIPHDAIERLPPPPPSHARSWRTRGRGIPASQAEVAIVNAALMLRRPLLVTGWPGLGLSLPAYRVAHELKLGSVLSWPITQRSTIKEGLYSYDSEARQQDAIIVPGNNPSSNVPDIGNYLKLGPLGTALLPTTQPRVLLIESVDRGTDDFLDDLCIILNHAEFEIPELARLRGEQMEINVHTYDGPNYVTIRQGRVCCNSLPFI